MDKNQQLKDINKRLVAKFHGKKLLLPKGNLNAAIMVVNEFPTPEEVHKDQPLSGAHGKIFNEQLRALGLSRRQLYITHAVKFAPELPNTPPTPKEIKQSSQFLREEIKLIQPKLIVALGNVSLRGLSVKLPLSNIRGKIIRFGVNTLFATHHPATAAKNALVLAELQKDFNQLPPTLATLA